jgi:hypothetical protein
MQIRLEVKIMFVLVVAFAVFSYVSSYQQNRMNGIERNLKIVKGKITKRRSGGYRGSYSSVYIKFTINNIEHEDYYSTPDPSCNIIGQEVLIALDSTQIDRAVFLYRIEDFNKFGLSMPDSLSWMIQCFKLGI